MQASIIRHSSAWDAEGIENFLRDSLIPLRLACLSRSGSPLICSLWFLYDDDALWCATQENAHVARLLMRDASCGFEVAADKQPYRGVRGQGRVAMSVADGQQVLGRLIDRYLGTRDSHFAKWLLSRQANEVSIRIAPDWVTSWDYSERMR